MQDGGNQLRDSGGDGVAASVTLGLEVGSTSTRAPLA